MWSAKYRPIERAFFSIGCSGAVTIFPNSASPRSSVESCYGTCRNVGRSITLTSGCRVPSTSRQVSDFADKPGTGKQKRVSRVLPLYPHVLTQSAHLYHCDGLRIDSTVMDLGRGRKCRAFHGGKRFQNIQLSLA